MTWQAIIEINNSHSPYLQELADLAKRTASDTRITGKRLEFIYNADKAQDLDIMINKVAGWKTTTVFLNGHTVRALALARALECMIYWDKECAHLSACKFCPICGNCEKATREELKKIAKRWEQDQLIMRYRINNPDDEKT